MVQISVIIPCFNHGKYLEDAFNSIELNKYKNVFECIIVNDGSTDDFTIKKINEFEVKGAIIIHQDNMGLAQARNSGIRKASGKYILLLDSDNKIIPEVFMEGLAMMNKNDNLDVFHTFAYFIGEKTGLWQLRSFDAERIFAHNHIDACALIRKSMLEKVGLYSTDMPIMGHEDWELWIKIWINSGEFYLYRKAGFYYRVDKSSMVNRVSAPQVDKTLDYIFRKHYHSISTTYRSLFYRYSDQEKLYREKIRYMEKNRLRTIVKLIIGKSLI